MKPAPSLKRRAAQASVWTIGSVGVQKALQLGSNIVLTRLLFPEAFGLMALASVFLLGIAMFSDVGIQPAVVQSRRGEEEAFLNAAWTIQVIRGFALWAAACLLAWPASKLYHSPQLWPLLSILGVTAAIEGFASTGVALAQRRVRIERLVIVQTAAQIITFLITVLFAWLLGSVWALAVGSIASSVGKVVLGHILLPAHRHRLSMEPEATRELFHFGRWIFLATMVNYLGGQGLRIIQGLLLPVATIGILSIAQTIAWALGDLTQKLLGSICFPALAEVAKDRPQDFTATLRKIRIRLLSLVLPGFIVLALGSVPLVQFLYDPRYASAGQYVAILSITGAIIIVPMAYQDAMLALGQAKYNSYFNISFLILRIIGLFIGFYIDNIIGMLVGMGIGSAIGYGIVARSAKKIGIFDEKLDAIAFSLLALTGLVTYWLFF